MGLNVGFICCDKLFGLCVKCTWKIHQVQTTEKKNCIISIIVISSAFWMAFSTEWYFIYLKKLNKINIGEKSLNGFDSFM